VRTRSRRATIFSGLVGMGLVMVAGLAVANPGRGAEDDAVRAMATWNTIALKTTAAGPFSPPRESRTMAMVSIAVFDAVNAITRRYTSFAQRLDGERTASITAAISASSYHVLAALYPAAASSLEASFDSSLARVAEGRASGVAVGEAAAKAVLANRAGDRAAERSPYAGAKGIGAWVSTPPAFAEALDPDWGKVAPFAMDSGAQFRPPPPPPPGTESYVRDYGEVVALGAATSAKRSVAQTEVARFWMSTAPQLWNQVARQLTIDRQLDPAAAARVYLLLNVAGADAMIAAWDAKYAYGQWRPLTAIRNLEDDGSPATVADTLWAPLLTTPPFPDYPAGHTAYGGAAEQVLIAIFGEKPGRRVSISSATANGATRHYESFTEICEEVVNARVWAGVHWRTSSTVGMEMGRKVAAHVLSRAPKAR
jgi:hypothetical protein